MPAFAGLHLYATCFARGKSSLDSPATRTGAYRDRCVPGQHKDEFCDSLSVHGARVTVQLSSAVNYLIVASPESPHSQIVTQTLDKVRERHRRGEYLGIKIVWEGWALEAMSRGVVNKARARLWECREGQLGPTAEEIAAYDAAEAKLRAKQRRNNYAPGPAAAAVASSMSQAMMDIHGPEANDAVVRVARDSGESGKRVEAVKAKARVKLGARMSSDVLGLDAVIGSYAGPSTSAAVPRQIPSAHNKALDMVLAEPVEPVLGAKGNSLSVIQALGTSRSTSFTTPTAPRRTVANLPPPPATTPASIFNESSTSLGPTRQSTLLSGPLEVESAFEDGEEAIQSTFGNMTLALVGLDSVTHAVATKAVHDAGGQVVTDPSAADWICVSYKK